MLTTPTATSETDPRILDVELCGGCGEAYVRNVLFEATQEVESNDGSGEAPERYVCRGADCVAVCECPRSNVVHFLRRCVLLQRYRGKGSY